MCAKRVTSEKGPHTISLLRECTHRVPCEYFFRRFPSGSLCIVDATVDTQNIDGDATATDS